MIVGLGNPGREYEHTRHNLGFDVIGQLALLAKATEFREKFSGKYARARLGGTTDVVLAMPDTFMNLSGKCVGPMATFFKVPLDQVVVVHDELDLPFGDLRIKKGGGLGGHNGLRDIIAQMGDGFVRVRVGIGKPSPGFRGDTADWVLARFDGVEKAEVAALVSRAAEAVVDIATSGVGPAMNRINTRKK